MTLQNRISEERKKAGLSQAELAEKLNVSWQDISLWEDGRAQPELTQLIEMAELFGVSTDSLIRGNNNVEVNRKADEDNRTAARTLTEQEAEAYISLRRQGAVRVAIGVLLCILSPVALIILGGLADEAVIGLQEDTAAGIGLLVLFGCIAPAIYLFVTNAMRSRDYSWIREESFSLSAGTADRIRAERKSYDRTYAGQLTAGIILCVISVVPLIVAGTMHFYDYICIVMTGVIFVMIAAGVFMIVKSAMTKGCFDALLQEGDYTKSEKKAGKKLEGISSIYWSVVIAAYLLISFLTMRWDMTWIIWPVAAVLYGVISGSVKLTAIQ